MVGATITGIVHANRQLDLPAPTPQDRRQRLWGSPTFGLGIVLVAAGLIAGAVAATLLDRAAGVRSPEELVVELCDSARSPEPGPAYLALDGDVQHNLADIDPDRTGRAVRAAAIVRGAAARPDPLDPELVHLLATEFANAAELGGGTPCD